MSKHRAPEGTPSTMEAVTGNWPCFGLSSLRSHPIGSRPEDCPECHDRETTPLDDRPTAEIAAVR